MVLLVPVTTAEALSVVTPMACIKCCKVILSFLPACNSVNTGTPLEAGSRNSLEVQKQTCAHVVPAVQ